MLQDVEVKSYYEIMPCMHTLQYVFGETLCDDPIERLEEVLSGIVLCYIKRGFLKIITECSCNGSSSHKYS